MTLMRAGKILILIMILYVNWIQYVFVRSGMILSILAIMLLAIVALHFLTRREKTFRFDHISNMIKSLVVFGFYAFLSGFFVAINVSLMISSIVQYFGFVSVCIGCYYIATVDNSMSWLMNSFSLCSLICSLQTIFRGQSYRTAGVWVTTMSENNNPNHLALIIILGMFGIISNIERIKKYTFLNLLVLFIEAYAVILTGSKKAFLSMVIMIFGWIIINMVSGNIEKRKTITINFSKLRRTLIFVVAFVVAFIYFNEYFIETSAFEKLTRMFTEPSTEDARVDLYTEAFQFFKENPIFGIGLRQFELKSSSGLYSHSTYAEVLSCTGLIGTIIFFVPVLQMLFKFTKKSFEKTYADSYHVRMLLLFLLIELFYSSVQIAIYDFDHMIIFVYLAWNCQMIEQKRNNIRLQAS